MTSRVLRPAEREQDSNTAKATPAPASREVRTALRRRARPRTATAATYAVHQIAAQSTTIKPITSVWTYTGVPGTRNCGMNVR